MNKKVKDITSDAIFVALLTGIILIFKYVFVSLESTLLLIISIFIGVRYYKESFKRMFIVTLSLLLISFLYFDILSILLFILPGILIGNISHYLLRIVLNVPYYMSTIFIYFITHSIVEILYSKLILNLSMKEYLFTGMEFPKFVTNNLGVTGLIIIFFAYNLILGIMEAFIIRKSIFIYTIKKKSLFKKDEN